MNLASSDAGLTRALAALSGLGVPARARAALIKPRDDVARRLREGIEAAVPAFRDSGDAQHQRELDRHAGNHVAELIRLLGGGAVSDFAFVREYARHLAGQGIPIEASLLAYRCMQPILLTWLHRGLKTPRAQGTPGDGQNLASVVELVTAYISAISIVLASEYVAHTGIFAEAEGDRRAELLSILVGGYDPSDVRVARLLKRAGYLEQRLSFCVALAQSTDPLEMENPARAQRIADAMVEAVAAQSVRVLVGVRSNLVTAVFSDLRRSSGWTAPQASLAERVKGPLLALGPAVLIGLSGDQASTSLIPRGVHEATVALDFANVTERLVPFYRISIRRLLIHRGADYVQSALPAWFARLCDADSSSKGHLVKTLHALADADMNVQAAARDLRVHPNTIYARIQRIKDLTGLDAHRYHDLTHLLLAVDCRRC